MPVYVLWDTFVNLWVLSDIFARSKGFFATQFRHFAEYLMSLAVWR